MTDSELEKILDRVKKTSHSSWKSFVEGRDFTSGSSFIMTNTGDERGRDIELIGASEADQDFIAAAKEDIPKLIAEIYRLKKLLKKK